MKAGKRWQPCCTAAPCFLFLYPPPSGHKNRYWQETVADHTVLQNMCLLLQMSCISHYIHIFLLLPVSGRTCVFCKTLHTIYNKIKGLNLTTICRWNKQRWPHCESSAFRWESPISWCSFGCWLRQFAFTALQIKTATLGSGTLG